MPGKNAGAGNLTGLGYNQLNRLLGQLSNRGLNLGHLEDLVGTPGAVELLIERLPGIVAEAKATEQENLEAHRAANQKARRVDDTTLLSTLDLAVRLVAFLSQEFGPTVGDILARQEGKLSDEKAKGLEPYINSGELVGLRERLLEGGVKFDRMPWWIQEAISV